jgi:xylulokinase
MAYRVMAGTIEDSFNCEFFVGAGTYLVNWFKTHQNLGEMGGKSPEVFWGERAAQVPIGSEHLYTIPYWNGALTPYWDQQARGAVIGYTGIHGNEHLYRSILEGIAFELRLSMEAAIPTIGKAADRLIAMGGGARSPLWCQMMADVLRIPITISKAEEATSLGAAMLGFTALGIYPDAKTASLKMSGFGITYEPAEEASEVYDRHFAIYRNLYPALKASFAEMAEL